MAGERNMTWLYVVGGAIVVLILVAMFLRH